MNTPNDPVALSTILAAAAALVSALTSVFAIGLAYYTLSGRRCVQALAQCWSSA